MVKLAAASSIDVEFWQRLVAAEAAPSKVRELLSLSTRGAAAVPSLLGSPLLSANERQRAKAVAIDEAARFITSGGSILLPEDLPESYSRVPSAPPVLFCAGDSSVLHSPRVGIVGTRAASAYGRAVAQKFAEVLARAGVTVVSGGALGIDAAAHKGALAAAGKTVAVLLTGIEAVYPRVHYGLFEQIKASGCLLSQFAVSTKRSREYRPLLRNQTVAALSDVLVVIEAPGRSGALSTASAANEMGRQVLVVPANVDNLNFRGSHALIRDGATLVDHPEQVLEAMGISTAVEDRPTANLNEVQQSILLSLTSDPLAAEFLAERTGLPMNVLMSELTDLELSGHVMRDPGGYIKCP